MLFLCQNYDLPKLDACLRDDVTADPPSLFLTDCCAVCEQQSRKQKFKRIFYARLAE